MDIAKLQAMINEMTQGQPSVYASWAVFGLAVGILAKILLPGRDPGGLVLTIGLGIAGAFVGNYLYGYCTGEMVNMAQQFSLSGIFLAVVGAVCLLLANRVLFGSLRSR